MLVNRNIKKYHEDGNGPLEMFVIDWYTEDALDETAEEESGVSGDSSKVSGEQFAGKFLIRAFGMDRHGQSICLDITDFQPYFYIKVPDKWTDGIVDIFINGLKQKIRKFHRDTIVSWKLINAKPFYYFTGDDRYKFKFIKLVFTSHAGYRSFEYALRDKLKIPGIGAPTGQVFERFESNILPLLRFLHIGDLSATGWITVEKGKYHKTYNETTTQLQLVCHHNAVKKLDCDDVPPIHYLSYDIEGGSSHGDFPIAFKDYQKLARDMITEYNRLYDDAKTTAQKQQIPIRPLLARLLELAFNPNYSNNNIRSVRTVDQQKPSEDTLDRMIPKIRSILAESVDQEDQLLELFELNCPPLEIESEVDYYALSDMICKDHARLKKTNNVRYQTHPDEVIRLMLELAFDDYYDNNNINVVYPQHDAKLPTKRKFECLTPAVCQICEQCRKHVIQDRKQGRRKLKPGETKITVDDFVEQLNKLFTQHFPALQADPIIQIGSVFKRYGEKDPYLKHIITLDTCSQITNETMISHEHKDITIPTKELVSELKSAGISFPEADLDDKEKRKHWNSIALEQRHRAQLETDRSQVIVESYQTEREVLLAWIKLVRETDPDLVIGYNIFGFDFKYIFGRAKALGIAEEFWKLGRIDWKETGKKDECVLVEQKLSSSGLGDNTLFYIQMFGRISIDMYKVTQASQNLESYKLDYVCKKFLGKSKNDLPPSEIFIRQRGTADDRRIIAEYCLIDCLLVTRYFDKMDIIINTIGMSVVCSVPFSFLFLRGQGIKLLSFVSKICRSKGYLLPVLKRDDDGDNNESYEGAIVLNAQNDIYFEPVAVADFNSLYPSCMISENLSHESFVGFKIVGKDAKLDYRGVPLDPNNQFETMLLAGNFIGWDYVDIAYEMYEYVAAAPGRKKNKKIIKGYKICRFAQPPNGAKSIVPSTLQGLLESRASTRKKQKAFEKGSFKYNVLEGRQLAYKVTANSLYGQTGARTSSIFLMDIAACTTATGRSLIKFSKKYCEKNYSATVVYGDSVAGYTPTIILDNDVIRIVNIENLNLGEDWNTCIDSDKEYVDLTTKNISTWTETGWTKINRIVRHKLDPHKKMFRILTHMGLVDATDDHSLLSINNQEVSPKNLRVGDELLHTEYPKIVREINSWTEKEARIRGFFMGDGSCDNSSWALSGTDLSLLVEYQQLCADVYPNFEWIIDSSHVVPKEKIPNYDEITDFVRKYRKEMYDGQWKIVPIEVLNGSRAVQIAFWQGLCDADQTNHTNQTTCAQIAMLGASLGCVFELNTNDDLRRVVQLNATNNPAITKLHIIPYSGYVYDLTTDNHHFQAGVGKLVVHNTDSIFVKFKTTDRYGNQLVGLDAVYKSMELCMEAASGITKQLKRPHNLDFEKAIWPFVLVSKKRYHGHYYTNYGTPSFYPNSMGIVLKRRDNAKIVKHVFGGMIDIIMTKHSVEEAVEFVKTECGKLLKGQFDLDFFTLTKTLRSYYKTPDQIAHNVLAQRIGKRDPGNKPQGNDRVPFAYIRVKDQKCLQGDKIETPEFIKSHDLKIDYRHYLTNQIMTPVSQILELAIPNAESIFDQILIDYDNSLIGAQKIMSDKFSSVIRSVKLNGVTPKMLKSRLSLTVESDKTHGDVEESESESESDDESESESDESVIDILD